MTASLFAGIDLHSNNLTIGIVDQNGQRLKHQKLDCDLDEVTRFLEPFKSRFKSLAVESTYNWYWLVDGLRARLYPVVLANPAQIDQYSGIKHADDKNDAFFLAELQRLGILPTGHIYDPVLRPVRDLLRRRLSLVHQRTALMLSFKSLYARTTGQTMSLARLKSMELPPSAMDSTFSGPEQPFPASDSIFSGPEQAFPASELTFSVTDLIESGTELIMSGTELTFSASELIKSKPELTFSVRELIMSGPELTFSVPDLIKSRPELVFSASELIMSKPV